MFINVSTDKNLTGRKALISNVATLNDSFELILKSTMDVVDILVNCAGVNSDGAYRLSNTVCFVSTKAFNKDK